MEVDLANILFSRLLNGELANLWNNWVAPFFGLPQWGATVGATAAGTSLGLSNLFGPEVGGTATGNTAPDFSGRSTRTTDSRLGEPVNPFTQPGEYIPPPPRDGPDPYAADRIARAEADRQRAYDRYQATHPGETTAPPPPPTWEERAADFFNRGIREGITGDRN
jgi:hypothetical protein